MADHITPEAAVRLVRRFDRLPMAKWEKAVRRLSTAQRIALSDTAAFRATRQARISAYVNRFVTGGTHTDAVKAQNKAARGTRQALGYTYKDDSITF